MFCAAPCWGVGDQFGDHLGGLEQRANGGWADLALKVPGGAMGDNSGDNIQNGKSPQPIAGQRLPSASPPGQVDRLLVPSIPQNSLLFEGCLQGKPPAVG
jgi:hypothetical protein